MQVDALTVTDESTNPSKFHHVVVWRHPTSGDGFVSLYRAAVDARGALSTFYARRAAIMADQRLSDAAKLDDVRKAGIEAARELGEAQRLLNRISETSHNERLKLAEVSAQPSAADAIVDLDIARHIRELGPDARQKFVQALVGGREPRAVEAVLRLPGFLVNLSDEMTAVIRSAAIEREHPEAVGRLRDLGEATKTAQHAIRRCADLLAGAVAMELPALMKAFGDSWPHLVDGPRDALQALAKKYAA